MNVKKGKDEYYICSFYSYVVDDYPFSPIICKTVNYAIYNFIRMVITGSISTHIEPELHIIGTCIVKKGRVLQYKPSNYIYRIDTHSLKSRIIYYIELFKNRITEFMKKG